jgi:hypothetical protein
MRLAEMPPLVCRFFTAANYCLLFGKAFGAYD